MVAPQLITNTTTNVTGMYTMFQYVVEVAPMFFILVLFALLVILFVVFRASSTSNAKPFAGSCFFVMVLSVLFRTLGFIENKWMYIFITLMGVAAIWLHLENSLS